MPKKLTLSSDANKKLQLSKILFTNMRTVEDLLKVQRKEKLKAKKLRNQ